MISDSPPNGKRSPSVNCASSHMLARVCPCRLISHQVLTLLPRRYLQYPWVIVYHSLREKHTHISGSTISLTRIKLLRSRIYHLVHNLKFYQLNEH